MKDKITPVFVDNRTEVEVAREASRMTGENYRRREVGPWPCPHLYPYLKDNPLLAWFVKTQEEGVRGGKS